LIAAAIKAITLAFCVVMGCAVDTCFDTLSSSRICLIVPPRFGGRHGPRRAGRNVRGFEQRSQRQKRFHAHRRLRRQLQGSAFGQGHPPWDLERDIIGTNDLKGAVCNSGRPKDFQLMAEQWMEPVLDRDGQSNGILRVGGSTRTGIFYP